MKRECIGHPKLYDLAARLDCSRPEAIGFLTLMWDFVASYATAGDIGRHPDGTIARCCDYMANPAIFIRALVDAGWLDESDEHRLVVHGWADHCPTWVRAKAQKAGIALLGGRQSGTIDRDYSPALKSDSTRARASSTSLNLNPPPPPLDTPTVATTGVADRQQVVAAVEGVGVATAGKTVRDALARGYDLAGIMAIVDHFCRFPGRWGPGALVKRLTELGTPQSPVDDLWPPDAPAWRPGVAAQLTVEEEVRRLPDSQVMALLSQPVRERAREFCRANPRRAVTDDPEVLAEAVRQFETRQQSVA